jgi:hypothetical protein
MSRTILHRSNVSLCVVGDFCTRMSPASVIADK